MQNFGNFARTSILSELSNGNAELGAAFAQIIDNMVVQNGAPNPKGESFDMTSGSWHKGVNNPDKTKEDISMLEEKLKSAVRELAESYLLFMAREVRNLTGKLDYAQYEAYQLKYRFGHYDIENKADYLNKVKVSIRAAFNKLSAHGEASGDNLIDKKDMAAFLYALAMKSKRDENGKFTGFYTEGIIEPIDYAVMEKGLFEQQDNHSSLKLRVAYKVMNDEL